MSRNSLPDTTPPKRHRTKAEREEHADYARRSVARKQGMDLFRACLWIPKTQKQRFQKLAAEAVAQHFARLEVIEDDPTPHKTTRATRHKAKTDPRQGWLPLLPASRDELHMVR